jgi:hypothetical protein
MAQLAHGGRRLQKETAQFINSTGVIDVGI